MKTNITKRSARHVEIYDALLDSFPSLKIVEEYNIGNNLFIDIYLPSFKIGIEIDGIQHSQFNSFFHSSLLDFNMQLLRDKKKNIDCKKNGIFLYRISHSDLRKAKDIINDIFNKYMINDIIIDKYCKKCNKPLEEAFSEQCNECLAHSRKEKNENGKYKSRIKKIRR